MIDYSNLLKILQQPLDCSCPILTDDKINEINKKHSLYCDEIEKLLPDVLYKYCEHTNKNIDLIIQNKMNFTNPSDFNDPYDSCADSSHSGAHQRKMEVDKILNKIFSYNDPPPEVVELQEILKNDCLLLQSVEYKEKVKKLKLILEEFKEQYHYSAALNDFNISNCFFDTGDSGTNQMMGNYIPESEISCFSTVDTNILMWAHYARSFTGMCIGYSKSGIIELLRKGEIFVVPVIYSKYGYPDQNMNISKGTVSDPFWNLRQFMYKAEDWNYENEWRIINLNSQSQIALSNIKSLTFGTKFSIYNKYSFHFNEKNQIQQDSEESQIQKYLELMNFISQEKITLKMCITIGMYKLENIYC